MPRMLDNDNNLKDLAKGYAMGVSDNEPPVTNRDKYNQHW